MSAFALDTHRTVKPLMEAGFSSEQAETVTDVLQETRASELSELATKGDFAALQSDLRTLETNLKADIRAGASDLRTVETNLKADIRTLAGELRAVEANLTAKIAENGRASLQWTVGLLVAMTAVIAGLIKLLAGH